MGAWESLGRLPRKFISFKMVFNRAEFAIIFISIKNISFLALSERSLLLKLRLKLVSAIFYQIFIFHQMIALQKL